ncbi:long tail fiber protein distal subunit [Cronobacter phage vB_CsaM_GAP161]|uniref:Long tail fiber protein Gp37 n=1 Tax=Cronobacter phage vB_CsaM_GAP161 TaxID=1141138 RepID=K4F7V0_9CAUD|nr:long tail fiber protein distal subunit [Cronobacter phage vB_CsaM_GAP161]AFC22368.1 small distal tail fiber subunit [Cronobacter phage vB_CsaM_GAP161]
MADLKLGTTLGGAGIWSASNLPLLPSGDRLTYKGWRVYTENDRPTAKDINALSTINGGTVAKNTTFNQSVTVGINLTANTLYSKSYVDITTGGAAPGILFKRSDVTGTPSTEQGIMQITGVNASGVTLATLNINARADGGNRIYLNAYKNGVSNTSFVVDSANQLVSVEQGSFRVAGSSTFAAVSATTLNVSGAITANTVTPTDWTNHDNRYITGIPRSMQGNSFGAAVVTEKNDVLSVGGNVIDGPYGNTTYSGQVSTYRRTLNSGVSLVQTYYDTNSSWIRSGSGSPGAWSWSAGDANGWRRIYDTATPPTPAEVGAVNKAGDTMSGVLTLAPISQPLKTQGGGVFAYDGNVYINKVGFSGWIDDLFFKNTGGVVTGTIDQDWLNQNVYCTSALSHTATGSKNYLRRFRGGNGDQIWHETVQGGTYRLATGDTDSANLLTIESSGNMFLNGSQGGSSNLFLDADSNSIVWYRMLNGAEKAVTFASNDGVYHIRTNNVRSNTWDFRAGMILNLGICSGTDYALIRGTPDGGGWDQWRERSSGLQIDMPNGATSAYNIWKATVWGATHVAAMDVHIPNNDGNQSRVRLIHQSNQYVYFDASGQVTVSGNGNFNDVYIRSDERLKSNLSKIESALDKVDLLEGVIYDKAEHIGGEPTTREAGLVAQQLQKVLPEAVTIGEDTKGNEILGVSSSAVVALLVNAIKELREEIRELKSR